MTAAQNGGTVIRLATEADSQAVRDIYAYYVEETPISFESVPPTLEEMAGRLRKIQQRFPFLVYEQQGQVIGYAYAGPHHERHCYRWSIDVSVYVHRNHHRNGVGRTLYKPLLECVKWQGFYKAHAGITLPNAGSVGIHESFGFLPVGIYMHVGYKFGRWHSVGWWQLSLKESSEQPAEPRAIEEVVRSPGFNQMLRIGL